MYIVTGLLGLGIIVFIHELGHYTAAKLVGIEVEAFALGWGPPVFSFQKGRTEYRLCLFPVGGYCKMKGEQIIEKKLEGQEVPQSDIKNSLFGVSPQRRIVTYLAGPLFNAVFAILLFSIVWIIGTDYQSWESKIVVISDYPALFEERDNYPVDIAGLQTGDEILSIGAKQVHNYRDLQEIISRNPDTPLPVRYLRDNQIIETQITPELNKRNGTGFIGIAPWIPLKISSLTTGSPFHAAGLRKGDLITEVNGTSVYNNYDFLSALENSFHVSTVPTITYMRNREVITVTVPVHPSETEDSFGLQLESTTFTDVERNPIKAVYQGISETIDVLIISVRGIGLLFKGIDLKETVSGPLRITYTVGQYAVYGFSHGIKTGLTTIFQFISFISVALCFMNLLPLPAVDGGMILYNVVEWIRKKPLSMKTFYRYQMAGVIVIALLLTTSLFNDIRYFLFK
ncbi:MAG: site-2 protease family protein [Spirochaetales bacterium]|nr:site-2 protease family protein [Spirochaetales bacterium]